MFDTQHALGDMAAQIRRCRTQDGLTLQQLATQSGVAASTIHKVEAGQMVPTVTVLLKIARGLGRRAEELVRDEAVREAPEQPSEGAVGKSRKASHDGRIGVWRIHLGPEQNLPDVQLAPHQRAIVLVEKGALQIRTATRRIDLGAGDCVEVDRELRIQSADSGLGSSSLTLIVSPVGDLERALGQSTGPRADSD